MRLEFIDRVKEGEVLGKSIFTNDGSVLLRVGVKLNDGYIKKLKELGVFYVYVDDERLEDVSIEDVRLEELKQTTIKNMSRIIKNINNGNSNQTKQSLKVVGELVDYIVELGDVNKSLYDIKTHDNYTYLHSVDTGIMAAFLGLSMGLNEHKLKELTVSAILHDIGKNKVPATIISKKGKLTEEEFEEIKKHPIYGVEILSKIFTRHDVILKAVEQHHERIDGKGYPYGLKGNEISKFGKIVSVCDVYDAVSNDRSYRKKFSPNEAYELILAGSGVSFDVEIVKKFKKTFSVYPLGCCLKLSNGIEGYVIKQNENFPDRPVIRVLYDSETGKPVTFYEIDLLEFPHIIVESIK
jgi:putative nucleotidyltransferase with HDIG domain